MPHASLAHQNRARSSDNDALLVSLGETGEEGGTGGVLENFAHALTGLGTALEVVAGTDLLHYGHALLVLFGCV